MGILESPIRTSQQVPALFLPISSPKIIVDTPQFVLGDTRSDVNSILQEEKSPQAAIVARVKENNRKKRKRLLCSQARARLRGRIRAITANFDKMEAKGIQKNLL